MLHKAWSSIKEVPYCFANSSVKFQGHTAKKIVEFDPNGAFPDCNSNWKSPMHLKWCTKLDAVQKKCLIVFRGHPSNFTVTQAEKLTIWIQFEITRPVLAIKSLRFALFFVSSEIFNQAEWTYFARIFFLVHFLSPKVVTSFCVWYITTSPKHKSIFR